mgnify:CR=1 FL=1
MRYKDKYTFERRCEEYAKVIETNPERLPVIIERAIGSDIPCIDKNKYLVPRELTIGQLSFVVRKRIHLSHEKALFLFVDSNVILPTGITIEEIYKQYAEKCGFLFIQYSSENTFGK